MVISADNSEMLGWETIKVDHGYISEVCVYVWNEVKKVRISMLSSCSNLFCAIVSCSEHNLFHPIARSSWKLNKRTNDKRFYHLNKVTILCSNCETLNYVTLPIKF